MNLLAWVQGLNGLTLACVIAALLFIEETGVPLPFAPGDLLLAIGGIAIAAGRVAPLMLIAVVSVAIVSGATLGREIFALVGWERLKRVARRLRIEAPLERASQMLNQNGWRAVFTARLIPGLRVHTTEVAGVSRMRRRSFLAGLLPATAVYVGAFVGLGIAFGRPILDVIHRIENQALVVVLALLAAGVLVLGLRAPVLRALASVDRYAWASAFVLRLDSPGVILIPACIGLNFAGHALVTALRLPLFLDSTGTILCGVLAGPWVGGSVGVITNLASSNTVDPIAAPYSVVSFAIGFAAGLARQRGWLNRTSDWLVFWPVSFLIASLISTPLNFLVSSGRSGVPLGDAIYTALATRLPHVMASYVDEAAIDLPDKLITVLGAMLMYNALPRPQAQARALELDIGAALAFVVRSRRWVTKLLIASLWLLFSPLLLPLLVFLGYAVAVAREAAEGRGELPSWDHVTRKLKDGFLISVITLIWNLPAIVLSIPDVNALAVVAGLWGLLLFILAPAIWSQYLEGGFKAAFNLAAIVRRIRFHLGLTLVVGTLGMVLPVLGLIGLIGLLVGVLATFAYAVFVIAYLFGLYARLTGGLEARAIAVRGAGTA